MSDNRLRFATYKYSERGCYHVNVTAKISLYKRELGLRDYLLIPRKHFYIKIEDTLRFQEKERIIDGENIEELNGKFERISLYYFVLSYLDSHNEISELPFLDFIDIGNYASFEPVHFSQKDGTYTFFMYCNRYLYPKISQLVGYDITPSDDYRIAWKVTESFVTLNKVKEDVNRFEEAPEIIKKLLTYQNHIEFKNLIFTFFHRSLYNRGFQNGDGVLYM